MTAAQIKTLTNLLEAHHAEVVALLSEIRDGMQFLNAQNQAAHPPVEPPERV